MLIGKTSGYSALALIQLYTLKGVFELLRAKADLLSDLVSGVLDKILFVLLQLTNYITGD